MNERDENRKLYLCTHYGSGLPIKIYNCKSGRFVNEQVVSRGRLKNFISTTTLSLDPLSIAILYHQAFHTAALKAGNVCEYVYWIRVVNFMFTWPWTGRVTLFVHSLKARVTRFCSFSFDLYAFCCPWIDVNFVVVLYRFDWM